MQVMTITKLDRTVIERHIRNVFSEGELNEKSNVQNMHIPKSDISVGSVVKDSFITEKDAGDDNDKY